MNFDSNVSDYKVVIFLGNLSMMGCKYIWKQTWDDYDYKNIQNICFLGT
jgi:hypothetical protein